MHKRDNHQVADVCRSARGSNEQLNFQPALQKVVKKMWAGVGRTIRKYLAGLSSSKLPDALCGGSCQMYFPKGKYNKYLTNVHLADVAS